MTSEIRKHIALVEAASRPLREYLDPAEFDELTFNDENELGNGTFRDVYQDLDDPGQVVKVQTKAKGEPRHNLIEWENWQAVRDDPDLAKWFAPCIGISECGHYLIQQKVDAPLDPAGFPVEAPALLLQLDGHMHNWGTISGRPVLFDYGFEEIGRLLAEDPAGCRKNIPVWFVGGALEAAE